MIISILMVASREKYAYLYLFLAFLRLFFTKGATRTCVSRLETSESALEMFNTEVFEQKFFKSFATFFVRNVPLGFR